MRPYHRLLALLGPRPESGPDAYCAWTQNLLDNLDAFKDPPVPVDEEDYAALLQVRSAISGLACHTFNHNHSKNDLAWALDSAYSGALATYNRRWVLPPGENRLLARYLLWRKRFTAISELTPLLEARDRGLLVRDQKGSLYVIGLNPKRGDNVTTVDRLGRDHRQYYKCIGRQAICIEQPNPLTDERLAIFLATVPPLTEDMNEGYIGDYKGGVRAIALTGNEKQAIYKLLSQSEHERQPRLEALALTVPTPDDYLPAPAAILPSADAQLPLFDQAA